MKIPLVSGPYDGQVYEASVDRDGIPELNILNMPRKTTIEEGRIDLLSDVPPAPVAFLRYRLKRVGGKEVIDGRLRDSLTKWHWEYHFEG